MPPMEVDWPCCRKKNGLQTDGRPPIRSSLTRIRCSSSRSTSAFFSFATWNGCGAFSLWCRNICEAIRSRTNAIIWTTVCHWAGDSAPLKRGWFSALSAASAWRHAFASTCGWQNYSPSGSRLLLISNSLRQCRWAWSVFAQPTATRPTSTYSILKLSSR